MDDKKTNPTARKRRRGNGEGSISQRKDGYWVGQITVGIDRYGFNQVRKSVVRKTRQEVVEELRKLQAQKKNGDLVKIDRITVEDWLDVWLNDYKKINVQVTTYDSYNITIKTHISPAIGRCQLQKLTTNLVQQFINDMATKGTSTRTIKYSVSLLSNSIKQAIKIGIMNNNNPCDNVHLPKNTKKEIKLLDREQLLNFKKCMEEYEEPGKTKKGYYLYPAFLILMTTGLRRGEVLGLTWNDVDLEQGILSIRHSLVATSSNGIIHKEPKTPTSKRDGPLLGAVVNVLRKHRETTDSSGLVFVTSKGNYIHPRSFQRSFDMLLRKSGIWKDGEDKPRIHDLRNPHINKIRTFPVVATVIKFFDIKKCVFYLHNFLVLTYSYGTIPTEVYQYEYSESTG